MPVKTFFTEEEKDLLQDLINKYKEVIENKRTDAVSLSAKAKAWEKLCAEYNSRPFVRARDAKQLKKLWDNMKQRWKLEKAKQIHYVMITGGGPPPQPMDDRLAQVEAVVPHLTVRVPNPFDSDRPLDDPPTQSASEMLNWMLHDSGPADSDEGAETCESRSLSEDLVLAAWPEVESSSGFVSAPSAAHISTHDFD
ncbi:myb/SANT-like DNA-binding domain-containing protein 3 [Dermacentor albipictus]|uniref:myb/SANT-like DNA-binding domain-containing protein 3 n=1 Tax=Dermacentor albipictus TaxID=60249 RepID=UPI0038FD17BC